MKNLLSLVLSFQSLSFVRSAEFKNLSFDTPEYPIGVPNPIDEGIRFQSDIGEWVTPGWSSSSGTGHNFTQGFNGFSSLLDANYENVSQPANSGKVPVIGKFSLGIWPASTGGPIPYVLGQTGDIPAGSQSLRFLYHGDNLKVYVGGVERLVHFAESRPSGDPEIGDLTYYAVDVGPFAGQSVELRFEFRSFGNFPGMDGGPVIGRPDAKFHVLDDLSFSSLPAVPEPSTWALFGGGAAAMLGWARRRC